MWQKLLIAMPNFEIFYYFGERSRLEIGYLYSLRSVIIIQTPLYVISTDLKVKLITQNHHTMLYWFLILVRRTKFENFDQNRLLRLRAYHLQGSDKILQDIATLTIGWVNNLESHSRTCNKYYALETFGFFGKKIFSSQPGL